MNMRGTKTVLIVGGSGFVGTHLALALRERYKVYATYCNNPFWYPGVTSIKFDITDKILTKRVLYNIRPQIIIYCAGRHDLEWAENNPRDSETVHANGPIAVLTTADIFQPRFILISSAYAFPGNTGNSHETETPMPVSQLGKNKVSGENFIKNKSLNYVTIRSSQLVGRGNGKALSALDRIRIALDKGERFDVKAYELHSWASVYGLGEMVEAVIQAGLRKKVLHYGGLTKMTEYDMAVQFARRFGFDPGLINAIRPSQYETLGEAALYDYSLNSTEAAKLLKLQPLLMEECFDLIEKKAITAA